MERWRGLLQQYNKDIKAAIKNHEEDRVIAYYQEVFHPINASQYFFASLATIV